MGPSSVLLADVAGIVLVGCLLWLFRSNSRGDDSVRPAPTEDVDKTLELAICSAVSPAEIDRVICCSLPRRAIVVVPEDQLALALGKDRQNEKVATDQSGWKVEIMTDCMLDERIENALLELESIPGTNETLADWLVGEGFLSAAELSLANPVDLSESAGLTAREVEGILSEARRSVPIDR